MRRDHLICRSRVLQALRRFFLQRDFIEVETPVRIPAPALELHIDAELSGDAYLRTSPELHMKRLLAGGMERIYQMGPCFRRGERGRIHHPEYTMLEWYRAHADYEDILRDTRALLPELCMAVVGDTHFTYLGRRIDVGEPWHEMSVRDLFMREAGWDPIADFDADRFDLDLVNKIEPILPGDRPVILRDYPAKVAALARLSPADHAVAERWELYLGGMELANAYSELVDAVEQRHRFEVCAEQRRAAGRAVYPLDEAFLAALPCMPPSGGIALGVDRLVMLLSGAESIEDVLACCV
ncbi:MAG: EF-P lysine aminoacylase GenX [Kiritimatiellae bacterium]|nr:EF-P lysine aminoacylase GenX [Kiritimatiellia bacterium]